MFAIHRDTECSIVWEVHAFYSCAIEYVGRGGYGTPSAIITDHADWGWGIRPAGYLRGSPSL